MLPTSRRGGSFLPRSPDPLSGSPSKSVNRRRPSARRRRTCAKCKSEWMTLFEPPTWPSRCRRLSSIGARSSRSWVLVMRADFPTQGLAPTVAEPSEQVVRIDVLRRHREYEAVRSTPESDLAEQTGHMRELAGVESSQNVGFSIPRVEELVRLQDDVSRSG